MSTAPTLLSRVEHYLAARRAMGFDLRGEGYQLRAFARFAEQQGQAGTLTVDLSVRWARSSMNPGAVTAARRLEVLRPFLRYCRQFDPATELVPIGYVDGAIGAWLRTFTPRRRSRPCCRRQAISHRLAA